nr:S9 family peptidase [candidate division Zixibacteria bacterium]
MSRIKSPKIKKRRLVAEDLYRLELMTWAVLSPDESRVAYTVETISEDHRKYFSHIYVADCKTGRTRQYTHGEVNDQSPLWSPDGRHLAFISTRNKKSGIYIIPTEGGAERKIIEEDGSFSSLVWTPDGRELVFVFRYNDSHTEKDDKKKRETPLYRHITRIFYRLDASGFLPKDRYHIWKVEIESGHKTQLTGDSRYDDYAPAVSPDGKMVTFVSNRSKNPDVDSLLNDLFIMPLKGGKEKKIKTPAGPITAPVFSPDSKRIAYIGHDNPDDGWGVENLHIWTVGVTGRPAARDLMRNFDRSVYDTTISDMGEGLGIQPLFWSPDGKRIYFASSDTGSTHLFYIPFRGGRPTRITRKPCHIKCFDLGQKGRTVAAVYGDLTTPGDLHLLKPVYDADRKSQKLITLNKRLFSEIDFPKTREIWFKSHDGIELQGWLVTPPAFNRRKKYPAILEIHGGPRTQYGFTFFHEMLWLASRGYIVFYTNPRGGTGRGETFADAISGGWGEIDYRDCLSAADYLEKLPYINPRKIGVTGGSYGGYMTNWIVGHTNRFRAAVTQRSVVNLESFYGSSDIGYNLRKEFDGDPWTNFENYRKCSPLTYAGNIKTPLLIIHSEQDLRCGIEQAEQLFATLKIMKKTVEMVRFPEEPHGLSRHGRPDRRIARLEWILKWFNKYLK